MRIKILPLICLATLPLHAQKEGGINLAEGLELQLEAQATGSTGNYAPTWFSSNRYGLTPVGKWSNYERATLTRDSRNDSLHQWRFGYGADVAVEFNAARNLVVEQAYVEAGYKKASLTLGSKIRPLEMRNQELSSGGMTFGTNARPIPQARIDIDYFSFPSTKGWWKWKTYGSFGMTTDGRWQKAFNSTAATPYCHTSNILYHEKALFWKFGKEDCPVPLVYEISLRFGTQFGGTTYNAVGRGINEPELKHPANLDAFLKALTCRGSDETDGAYKNTAGNHVGSYLMALGWQGKTWQAKAYFERFFEDQSMLTVQYGIRDHIFGFELNLPRNRFLSNVVIEQMSTRDQSGAVYHDPTQTLPDKMAGLDDYYNHSLYAGWQHYGMGIGHPFLTSPIYNTNGQVRFLNNRLKAWHVGLNGDPSEEWHWRLMLSFTKNWGSVYYPTYDPEKEQYLMAEATYKPRWARDWSGTLGLGLDHGDLGKSQKNLGEIGNSLGVQLTLRKTFRLGR